MGAGAGMPSFIDDRQPPVGTMKGPSLYPLAAACKVEDGFAETEDGPVDVDVVGIAEGTFDSVEADVERDGAAGVGVGFSDFDVVSTGIDVVAGPPVVVEYGFTVIMEYNSVLVVFAGLGMNWNEALAVGLLELTNVEVKFPPLGATAVGVLRM